MIIAIQQPEHLPWVGFFNKMTLVDEFIYLDNVQFKKRYFENRNKVRAQNPPGWDWITVPVLTGGRFKQNICEVEIDYGRNWQKQYLNKLRHSYQRAPFFGEIFDEISLIIGKGYKTLLELNLSLIEAVQSYLGLNVKTLRASDICEGRGSDLILEICLNRGADTYLSGPDGRNYLDADKFSANSVKIIYHDYKHPEYAHFRGEFLSGMSVFDLIANCGKDSRSIIISYILKKA